MKKTAIIIFIVFTMSIIATSTSAQPLSPCDPVLNACVTTQLTGCNPQFNICEPTGPGQDPSDPILEKGGGWLRQGPHNPPQDPNETFDRVMEIMRRHNQTRINIIRGF